MKKRLYMLIIIGFALTANAFDQTKKNEVIKDSVVDSRDGHVYKALKIRNQTWMAENLKWECEGSFVYEDLPKNQKKHGRLYTYDASRNACPAGTHLPARQEWDTLRIVVDPNDYGEAGNKLLKKTNPGFAATLGGYRNGKGKFTYLDNAGCYWGSDNAVSFSTSLNGVNFVISDKIDKSDYKNAYSIRCIKDY